MHIKFAILLVTAVMLLSCNGMDSAVSINAQAPSPSPSASLRTQGSRRVTTAELEKMLKDGTAFVVDVRFQDAYDQGHIPGSKLIPEAEILNHINELPRDKTIVTYCS
jgi:3-mercaptopyruvate sulfurtransferase SseA